MGVENIINIIPALIETPIQNEDPDSAFSGLLADIFSSDAEDGAQDVQLVIDHTSDDTENTFIGSIPSNGKSVSTFELDSEGEIIHVDGFQVLDTDGDSIDNDPIVLGGYIAAFGGDASDDIPPTPGDIDI